MSVVTQGQPAARSSIVNDPKFRSLAIQLLLVLAIGWFVWVIARNTQINLQNRNIASGFQFLWSTAGFGVNQALISYTEASSYGRALLVGFLNTLLVAGVGIRCATILLLVAMAVGHLIDWAVLKAVLFGEDRTACVASPEGACWAFVRAKLPQWVYGFYPIDQRWRVDLAFLLGAGGLIPMLIPSIPSSARTRSISSSSIRSP